MPYINQEEIVGWYNADTDHFLCDGCFSKIKETATKSYGPVVEDEMDSEDLYICDECGERFYGSH